MVIADIPLGGKIRATVVIEVSGEIAKNYTLAVRYGTIDYDFGLQPIAGMWGSASFDTAMQTVQLDIDVTVPLDESLVGNLDAEINVSDGVSATGEPTGTLWASGRYDDMIRLYLPFGASIVSVTFSSV